MKNRDNELSIIFFHAEIYIYNLYSEADIINNR